MPQRLRKKCILTPDGGARDLRELMLVDEVFRQRKPLLAICRGHQILNVALGGTLFADLATQLPAGWRGGRCGSRWHQTERKSASARHRP
jgi:gamma-glutamyl-gamma-aminobutyrate hydrolase PuuD